MLQNFNSDNFDILVQAKDLYKFTILTCIALGVLFQVPVGILALTSLEIVSRGDSCAPTAATRS